MKKAPHLKLGTKVDPKLKLLGIKKINAVLLVTVLFTELIEIKLFNFT